MAGKNTQDVPAEDVAPVEGGDVGQAEVQKATDVAEDKGYLGHSVDPTPNEHYTVAGVIAGKPTPETDDKAAADAFLHQRELHRTVFSGPTSAADSK